MSKRKVLFKSTGMSDYLAKKIASLSLKKLGYDPIFYMMEEVIRLYDTANEEQDDVLTGIPYAAYEIVFTNLTRRKDKVTIEVTIYKRVENKKWNYGSICAYENESTGRHWSNVSITWKPNGLPSFCIPNFNLHLD